MMHSIVNIGTSIESGAASVVQKQYLCSPHFICIHPEGPRVQPRGKLMKCASFTGIPSKITKLAHPTTEPVTAGNETTGGKSFRDI